MKRKTLLVVSALAFGGALCGEEVKITNIKDTTLNAVPKYQKRVDGSHPKVVVSAMRSWASRGLMKFDLSKVKGRKILGAKLKLKMLKYADGKNEETVSLHELLKPWDEAATNWANFNDGGKAGTEYKEAAYAKITWTMADAGKEKTFNLKPEIFQKWADDPASNNGFILINESVQAPASNRGKGFVSSDAPVNGPILILELEDAKK